MYNTQNIVNLHRVKDQESWVKEEDNVYIGRRTKRLSGSKWGNPYKLGNWGRKLALSLYEIYIQRNKGLLNSLHELSGKTLGCWCAPQLCHGGILHHLAGNIPVYHSIGSITQGEFVVCLGNRKADLLVRNLELKTKTMDFDTLQGSGSDSDKEIDRTTESKKKSVVYYEKDESVSDSFIGKFTTVANYSKRTALQKRMFTDKFDSADDPVFRQNKSGFCTLWPICI